MASSSPAASMSTQEMALYAAGAFVTLTAIGYIHDNYWDPSRRPRKSRLPTVGKTELELGFGGRLPPLELLNKMMKMGDELKQAKHYKEAEKYYLRLYALISDMPLNGEEKAEMGAIVLTHLILNYKLMRRWDLMSAAINELFIHQTDPLQRSEWMFPLVDALTHQKRYSEAISTGEEIKKCLSDLPAGAPVKRMQFQAQEQMSNVFWAAGQLDKAEAEMTEALSIRGNNPARALELELNLASLYLVKGDIEKAEKTIENWSNRPELKGKTEVKKKITIATCYYRANQLEVADSMFSKLLEEATGTDHEECLSTLTTIAHEKDDSKRARSHYPSLRKTTTYVRTMSRYLVTTSATFREKKMEVDCARGVWNVVLQIRSLLVKSLPGLKVGNVMRVSVETVEGSEGKEEGKQKEKEEEKEEDKKEGKQEEDKKEEDKNEGDKKEEDKKEEEKPLKMEVKDVTITKEMLDEDFIEFETPETVVPRRKKMLIEVQIFTDSKKEEMIGFHYQLARLS